MKINLLSILSSMLLLAGILAVAGCNTVAGAGRDVEEVGKTTTQAAEDVGGN